MLLFFVIFSDLAGTKPFMKAKYQTFLLWLLLSRRQLLLTMQHGPPKPVR
jgi:hypothetical protein